MSKERLVELLEESAVAWDKYIEECFEIGNTDEKTYDEFHADYLLANGVIVPPCKVGDTVYEFFDVRGFYDINELIVTNIMIGINPQKCVLFTTSKLSGSTDRYFNDCFGKTIFFSREEAEKALEDKKYER